MRCLCASNLHLGRRVAGLPEHAGIDPARLSASATWTRLANAAVTHDVDAILLAGDTIDRENPLFEPVGALQQGLGILQKADIPVVMIVGDEDVETLPRALDLLAATPGAGQITLLDHNRPSFEIGKDGDRLTVIGVSETGLSRSDSPLDAIPDTGASSPTVVMLHASLTDGNAPDGTFQPVNVADLRGAGVAAWILGAQREPDALAREDTTVIEPGATFPAGPEETGMRGATLVTISRDGDTHCELVPLAPIRYEDIDLDLSGIDSLEAVESALVQALHDELDDALALDVSSNLAALVCIVHLSGATSLHAEIPALIDELERTLAVQHQGVTAAIGEVEIDTRPDLDIEPLLGRPDPVGELARLLHALDEEGTRSPAQEALVQRAVDRLVGVHRSRVFARVAHDDAPDAETARIALRREAWNVLDVLVRQRGID